MQCDMRSAFGNMADNNLHYYEEVKPFLIAFFFFFINYFSGELNALYLKKTFASSFELVLTSE